LNKNTSSLFEYQFDFERYLEEQIRKIDDLDERRYAKTVLLEGLGNTIRHMESKYKDLERRVYEEIEIPGNRYEICSTIIKREHFDPTNETLFPVCMEDLEESLEGISAGEDNACVMTVYLELDDRECSRFSGNTRFPGTITKDGQRRPAEFTVRQSARYQRAVENLYRMFGDNHISWMTMNTGHFDKFYDVFLDEGTVGNKKDISFKEIAIDFGVYEKAVRRHCIPLWNIRQIRFASTHFMMPCIDDIYYEHVFSLEDGKQQDGYLIQNCKDILEIRHEAGKIIMKSKSQTFEHWAALRIIQKEPVRSLDYDAPILTNHKKDNFFRRYSETTGIRLQTKTDLFRRIQELDIRDYIEISDYGIRDSDGRYPMSKDMNWFVNEELFPMESRKVLLLKFKEKRAGHYLNFTMVRFAVSCIQSEISEYRCVGVIV